MLIIVGAKNEFNLDTHADIEELSCYASEKEVFFSLFPLLELKTLYMIILII